MFILLGCEENTPNEETIIETPTAIETQPSEPSDPTIIPTEPEISWPVVETYERFQNPYGYASLGLTTRNPMIGYKEVSTELEFLDALLDSQINIIEIKEDLNMGYKHVETQIVASGKTLNDYRNVYRKHSNQPLLHPTLIEHGVGHIRLVQRDHITILSKYGATISHAPILIDESNDIVIRNLRLSGIWEWDEEQRGQYKRNDWDYFTIEKSSNIWIDHITFEQAYDGIIDVKEESENITLSWSKLLFKTNTFIEEQINYLEENRHLYAYYDELRTSGVSKEDIITHSSFQKKGFNLGNTTDGTGFESITMTFHHLEIYNLSDRMPRIRKGDVHVYHIIVDNQELYELRLKLSQSALPFVNQAIVTTEDGAVFMENSIFKYVTTPIRNHQDGRLDSAYTGRYKIVNSELILPNRIYFGSSDDHNSLWIHDNSAELLPFRLRNHLDIPYAYHLSDIYFLPTIFENFPVGHTELPEFDWLNINLD
jgi:pectate lyase